MPISHLFLTKVEIEASQVLCIRYCIEQDHRALTHLQAIHDDSALFNKLGGSGQMISIQSWNFTSLRRCRAGEYIAGCKVRVGRDEALHKAMLCAQQP